MYCELVELVDGYTFDVPINIPDIIIYPIPNKNLDGMNFFTNIFLNLIFIIINT